MGVLPNFVFWSGGAVPDFSWGDVLLVAWLLAVLAVCGWAERGR